MVVYFLLILLCYLSMILYREIFPRKPAKIWHAVIPSGVFFMIYALIYPSFNARNVFSPWIYPAWFFALISYIEMYLILMIPMFFGAVYLDDRRKAWSAMIAPVALTVFIFAWLGGGLFYETGWLAFYMLLLYLAWGAVCALTPRLVWTGYVTLRDKSGGRVLFKIITGIVSAAGAVAALIIIFTIAANAGKAEDDYMPPPLTTTDVSAELFSG